jgi:uncharacterized protein (DUF362 family)
MLGYHRSDRSNVVDPHVVEGVARYCRRHGATDVAVLEAPTVYERFFARRSVVEVAAYFGYESRHYRLVDVSTDQVPYEYERGVAQATISSTWSDADVRIVLPKLRTDPTEVAHLSLSTLEGMDGRPAENIHAGRRISCWNATMMLLDAAPPDFAVVDAWGPIADGPFGVMGCDDPAFAYRIYAGADALAVDAAVLADLGFTDARRAMIVRSACHWFGLDLPPVDCRGEPGSFGPGLRGPFGSSWSRLVARLGYPVYAYASGNGKRFVPAMDTAAFPPLGRVDPVTALVRRSAQAAFGLRPRPPNRTFSEVVPIAVQASRSGLCPSGGVRSSMDCRASASRTPAKRQRSWATQTQFGPAVPTPKTSCWVQAAVAVGATRATSSR